MQNMSWLNIAAAGDEGIADELDWKPKRHKWNQVEEKCKENSQYAYFIKWAKETRHTPVR